VVEPLHAARAAVAAVAAAPARKFLRVVIDPPCDVSRYPLGSIVRVSASL
jgi:hypothetical protein